MGAQGIKAAIVTTSLNLNPGIHRILNPNVPILCHATMLFVALLMASGGAWHGWTFREGLLSSRNG